MNLKKSNNTKRMNGTKFKKLGSFFTLTISKIGFKLSHTTNLSV
jgi:hypothetical protein